MALVLIALSRVAAKLHAGKQIGRETEIDGPVQAQLPQEGLWSI